MTIQKTFSVKAKAEMAHEFRRVFDIMQASVYEYSIDDGLVIKFEVQCSLDKLHLLNDVPIDAYAGIGYLKLR